MKTVRQEVSSCTSCPYAADGSDSLESWTCHAEYTSQGWPLRIPTPTDAGPPKFCPLRRASRLVVMVAL